MRPYLVGGRVGGRARTRVRARARVRARTRVRAGFRARVGVRLEALPFAARLVGRLIEGEREAIAVAVDAIGVVVVARHIRDDEGRLE